MIEYGCLIDGEIHLASEIITDVLNPREQDFLDRGFKPIIYMDGENGIWQDDKNIYVENPAT